jgi:hypothetical protein
VPEQQGNDGLNADPLDCDGGENDGVAVVTAAVAAVVDEIDEGVAGDDVEVEDDH